MAHTHAPQRRNFLTLSARLAALGLTGLGLRPWRSFFDAEVSAATTFTDYKALVCIYLSGGNDSNNMIVPVDNDALHGVSEPARRPRADRQQAARADRRREQQSVRAALRPRRAEPALQRGPPGVRAQRRPAQPAADTRGVPRRRQRRRRTCSRTRIRRRRRRPDRRTPNGQGWGGRLLDRFGVTDTLAAVSVSSPALFLQGVDVRGNVDSAGREPESLRHELLAAGGGRRRRVAVNAMLAARRRQPAARGGEPSIRRRPAARRHAAVGDDAAGAGHGRSPARRSAISSRKSRG